MNPESGLWEDGEGWTFAPELSIGGGLEETRPEYIFGQIAAIGLDPSGNIYVSDMQAQEVRSYDATGAHLHTYGRPGSGPGELGFGVAGLGIVGDQLLIADAIGNQRITRYSIDGEYLGSFPFDITQGVPFRWDASDTHPLVAQRRLLSLTGEDLGPPTGDPVMSFDPDGNVTDTLLVLTAGSSFQIQGGQVQFRFFDPEPMWDLGDDGWLVSALNSIYRIEVRDPSGTLVRIVERPFEPKAVTQADQDAVMGAIRDLLGEQGLPPEAMDLITQQASFAETFPAFASILAGPDGSLWVQRLRSGSELGGEDFNVQDLGSPVWDVFDAEGRYLGEVEVPARFQPLRFSADLVYGIGRDELDFAGLKKYSVCRRKAAAEDRVRDFLISIK